MATGATVTERGASKERTGTFNISRRLTGLSKYGPFIAPKGSFWHYFQLDAREWTESGGGCRFIESDQPGFLLDTKTGDLWPVRAIQMLSRYPVFV